MKFFNLQKKTKSAVLKAKLGAGEQALHDWKIMLLVFTILIVLIVLLDGYLFMQINEGNFFSTGTDSDITPANTGRKTLLDANTFFDARQTEYGVFEASSAPEIDPSI